VLDLPIVPACHVVLYSIES